ncbi:MAG: thiamine pyrophosphate-dependent enzyme [Acidimicrobiales bacterium]|tara:strand:+ start:3669 stop:5312 length:1644 start_codon:yes stop_codon:yes gene_type:complete
MNGGHLLVEGLVSHGVNTAFAVPGESYLEVLDALYEKSDQIRLVGCRQEGGAAYMAEAYGRLTGQPGICFVTRGPGATNASIGIHTAAQGSTPLILFIGQVPTSHLGFEAFQEMDYTAFFGGIAKWVTEITHPDQIPEVINKAFRIATSDRPGPVVIALPEDVLGEETEKTIIPFELTKDHSISEQEVQEIMTILEEAKKPVLLAGGGGWTTIGRENLCRFAEKQNLPVVVGFRRQDLMDNNSSCYAGEAGVAMPPPVRQTLDEADVILAVGVRFGEMTTNAYTLFQNQSQKILHVHASEAEFDKVVKADLHIRSNPNLAVAALLEMPSIADSKEQWREETRNRFLSTHKVPTAITGVDMAAATAYLQEVLPEDVIITNGAGNFSVWPNKFFLYGSSARLLAPQNGTMGYGVPAAISAKVAAPERVVVCFAGDGDFQMNMQELGSAAQEEAQPIVLIVNNSMYGTIRMHQERRYPERVVGTDIKNPDFVSIARAYGFYSEQVTSIEEFKAAFDNALDSKTGAVLDLIVDPEMLTPQQSITQVRSRQG